MYNKKDAFWLKMMNLGRRVGCHQMPGRSFFFKGYQFPVCARCTGILCGEILSAPLLISGFRPSLMLSLLFMMPMAIDGGLQYIKVWESTNIRRLISGILGGMGLIFIYCHVISRIVGLLMSLVER